MTARRSMVVLAVLLAGLILLLLAGLFLIDRTKTAAVRDDSPSPATSVTPAIAKPASPTPPTAPSAVELPDTAAEPEDPASRHRLHVRVRFEDGSACDEGSFLEMIRSTDGTLGVSLESEMKGGFNSIDPGDYILSWATRPETLALLLVSRELEAVSVSGGTVLPPEESGSVIGVAGDGPLEITVRWRPGCGWIAAKMTEAGPRLCAEDGLTIHWRHGDGTLERVDTPARGRSEDRWYRVHPPSPPKGEDASSEAPVLEVRVEKTAVARVALEAMHGRVEAILVPTVPDVTGSVIVPGGGGKRLRAGWALSLTPEPRRSPEGIVGQIESSGRLQIFNVPDGSWTLSIWAMTSEGLRWGWRSFEKAGSAVSLGDLEVGSWSGFRVRVLDADGTPIPVLLGVSPVPTQISSQSGLLIFDDDDDDDSDPKRFENVVLVRNGAPSALHLSSPEAIDPQGWTTIRDLRPGMRYRLWNNGATEVATEEDAPARSGVIKDIEIKTAFRPVRVSLRFTVGGAAPTWSNAEASSEDRILWEFSGAHGDGALPESGWRADGTWSGSVYPGTYRVRRDYIPEKATDSVPTRQATGTVAIPAGESYEATVDLK